MVNFRDHTDHAPSQCLPDNHSQLYNTNHKTYTRQIWNVHLRNMEKMVHAMGGNVRVASCRPPGAPPTEAPAG